MPNIGLVIRPEDAASTLAAKVLLAGIGAKDLLLHFDPLAGHNGEAFRDFAKIHTGSTMLEIALPCQASPADECKTIAAVMQQAGSRPDAIMILPVVDRQSTPPGSVWPKCWPLEEVHEAAHTAFVGIHIGGGMLSYFTELNRKRVPYGTLFFVSHYTNHILYASDD